MPYIKIMVGPDKGKLKNKETGEIITYKQLRAYQANKNNWGFKKSKGKFF